MLDQALQYASALYEENGYPTREADMFEDVRAAYEEGWMAAYKYYVERDRKFIVGSTKNE